MPNKPNSALPSQPAGERERLCAYCGDPPASTVHDVHSENTEIRMGAHSFIASSDGYVAWCRYTKNGPIVTCDSDAPGAFKVYRHQAARSSSPEGEAQSINFMQTTGEGMCFAHGPYKNPDKSGYCPKWPACITDPQKPEYLAMSKVAAAPSREWIKTEDRLPDEDELVLVAVKVESDSHDGTTQRWAEVHEATIYSTERQVIAVPVGDTCEYEGKDILGWMPLPEPPEEILTRHAAQQEGK